MTVLNATSLADLIKSHHHQQPLHADQAASSTRATSFRPFDLPPPSSLQGELHSVRVSSALPEGSLAFQILLSSSMDGGSGTTKRVRVDIKVTPSEAARKEHAKTIKDAEIRLKSSMGKVVRVSAYVEAGEEERKKNRDEVMKVVRVENGNMLNVEIMMRKGGHVTVLDDVEGTEEKVKEIINFALGSTARPSWISQSSSQSTTASTHESPIASFDTTHSMIVDPDLMAAPAFTPSTSGIDPSRKRQRSNEGSSATGGPASKRSFVTGWLSADMVTQPQGASVAPMKKKKNLSDLTRTVLGGLAKEDAIGAVGIEVVNAGIARGRENATTFDPLAFDPIVSASAPARKVSRNDDGPDNHPFRRPVVAPHRRLGLTTSAASDDNSGSGTQSSTASKGKGVAKSGSASIETVAQPFRAWESEEEDEGQERRDRMDVDLVMEKEIAGAGMFDLDQDMEEEGQGERVESPQKSPILVTDIATSARETPPLTATMPLPNAQRAVASPTPVITRPTPTIVNPALAAATLIPSISPTLSVIKTKPLPETASGSDALHSRLAKQRRMEKKLARNASKKSDEIIKREEQRLQLEQRVIEAYIADPTLTIEYNEGVRQKKIIYRTLASLGANEKTFDPMTEQSAGGTRADLIVAIRSVDRPLYNGVGDHLVNFTVQDPSRWEDDDFLRISIFSREDLKLPEDIQPGSCLLIRNTFCKRDTKFGRVAAKCSATQMWQFALLAKSSDGEYNMHRGQQLREPKYPGFSPLEMQHMQRVCDWYAATVKMAMGRVALLQSAKPHVTLSQLEYGQFCNVDAVEIVGLSVYSQEAKMEIYVTDYSYHPDFYLNKDSFQRPGLRMPGMVTEVTLWDDCAAEARDVLAAGMFIAMSNLQVQNRLNGIQGALRSTYSGQDSRTEFRKGQSWRILTEGTDAVKKLLQRRDESIGSVEKGKAPEEHTAEIIQPDVYADAVGTRHTYAQISTIKDVLANQTIPNRFRIKAKVASMFPGKAQAFIIAWCKTCDRRFRCFNCEHCNDRKNSHAEYRYRFVVMLEDKSAPEAQLPVQMWHPHVADMLSPLPTYPQSSANLKAIQTSLAEAGREVGNMLYGTKRDGARPFHVIDWSIESFWAQSPDNGQQQRMFRAFDMVELGR